MELPPEAAGDSPGDLLVLTSYFNSEHFLSRRRNFEIFAESLRQRGVPLLTVECAFGGGAFDLAPAPSVAQVGSSSVLWQKERLLNLGLQRAPSSFTKVAWIDADVLFENPRCFSETSRLLDEYPVVQMFESVARLPREQYSYQETCTAWKSFGARTRAAPGSHFLGWFRHGHTGFAWAARREVFDGPGFFDLCMSGANDHLMAHAFMGDWYSNCIEEMIGLGSPIHSEYRAWGRKVFKRVDSGVGVTPGRALHLWHGDDKHRTYHKWSQEFKACKMQPKRDVRLNETGCWEWTGANPALESWSMGLFSCRNEDG